MEELSIFKDHSYLLDYKLIDDTHYTYNDHPVPRVTHIFNRCIGNQALVDWAAKVGYKATKIRDEALAVGTVVHSMIENYFKTGQDMAFNPDDYGMNSYAASKVENSYHNFKEWKYNLDKNGNHMEIIGLEVPVTCPWFGGTIDCITIINGAVYVIDFKTSKEITEQYIMQTCAYAWMINSGYCSLVNHVDGIGILRFDKSDYGSFEEYFLNYHIPYQNIYLQRYTTTFFALLNSYYHLNYTKQMFYNSNKEDHEFDSVNEEYLLSKDKENYNGE